MPKTEAELLARDEIVRQGWCFSANIDPNDISPRGKALVVFYQRRPHIAFRARAATVEQATHLAIAKLMDAAAASG